MVNTSSNVSWKQYLMRRDHHLLIAGAVSFPGNDFPHGTLNGLLIQSCAASFITRHGRIYGVTCTGTCFASVLATFWVGLQNSRSFLQVSSRNIVTPCQEIFGIDSGRLSEDVPPVLSFPTWRKTGTHLFTRTLYNAEVSLRGRQPGFKRSPTIIISLAAVLPSSNRSEMQSLHGLLGLLP